MMTPRRILSALALAAAVAACTKSEAPTPAAAAPAATAPMPSSAAASAAPAASPPLSPSDRAQAAAQKLKGAVMQELTKAVADKGAAGAVDVCGAAAAKAHDTIAGAGLELGRTSSKLRNPANTAPVWVGPLLADLEAAPKDKRTPREIALPDGGLGRVEPLIVMPLCLQCHGNAITGDVTAAIAAKYPADQATGYAEGDLRGVVWVELKGPAGG